jgi:CHAD domain-containing protein
MAKISTQQATTFGDWANIAIAKHTEKFQQYELGVLEDQDPENLHQMRVGMRRLRSAMTGFGLGLNLPKKAAEKIVGKIAKILGELRDLDVLLDTLQNKYQPDLPPKEQKELKKVVTKLEKKRLKIFQKVKSLLEGKLYSSLKKSLKKWLKNPKYQPVAVIDINQILPDLLLPQISNFLLHPGWLVGVEIQDREFQLRNNFSSEKVNELLDAQGESLHSLRKEAKRTRYQMELFTEFYGDDYQNYLHDIKKIQSVLGDIQDSVVLRDVLQDILAQELVLEMPVFSKLLLDNRYQKWQEWRKLQIKLLNPSNRHQFRNIINNNLGDMQEQQKKILTEKPQEINELEINSIEKKMNLSEEEEQKETHNDLIIPEV